MIAEVISSPFLKAMLLTICAAMMVGYGSGEVLRIMLSGFTAQFGIETCYAFLYLPNISDIDNEL